MRFVSLEGEIGEGKFLPECLENVWEPEKIRALGRYTTGPRFWLDLEKVYCSTLLDEAGDIVGRIYEAQK